MGKVPPPLSPNFFLHDEQTGQWTLSLVDPEEGKKTASLSGVYLLETMKRRQKEEEDRVLYVALTRAEESVSLIWLENPKSESWAARMPLRLEVGEQAEEHFLYRVRKGLFQPQKFSLSESKVTAEVAPYRSTRSNEDQNISVTEIIEAKAEGQRLKAEMADVQKAVTGVDVHRMFESLKYKWMKDPSFDWRSWLPELPESHRQALQFLAKDEKGRWLEIIRNGHVEYGLAVKLGAGLLQGQIDLWGQDSSGQVWVVDYKTGSPKYQEKAFQQLEVYLWALNKMKKIADPEKVILAVIYPFSEMTLVRQAPSIAKIEKSVLNPGTL
jgi:ATP-dependent helicase/nuclease subunit A